MDLHRARAVNSGPGDGLAAAFELIATPGIFAFGGFLLDRWVGTLPLFTLLFGLSVLGYEVWRVVVGYEAEMQAHERNLPGGPNRG